MITVHANTVAWLEDEVANRNSLPDPWSKKAQLSIIDRTNKEEFTDPTIG
jgi:hypothetical protein